MFIEETDLAPFATIESAKALAMIEDAEAQSILAAPCLSTTNEAEEEIASPDLTPVQLRVIKSILRAALLRWDGAGNGGTVQQTAGPFSQTIDSGSNKFGRLWPSEIEQLQSICEQTTIGKAFSISQVPSSTVHLAWCTLELGGNFCSCGADIAGTPIYENL